MITMTTQSDSCSGSHVLVVKKGSKNSGNIFWLMAVLLLLDFDTTLGDSDLSI